MDIKENEEGKQLGFKGRGICTIEYYKYTEDLGKKIVGELSEKLGRPLTQGLDNIKSLLEKNNYIDKEGNILSKIKRVVIKDGEGTFDEAVFNKAEKLDFLFQKGGVLEKDLVLKGTSVTLAGGKHAKIRTGGDVHLISTQKGKTVTVDKTLKPRGKVRIPLIRLVPEESSGIRARNTELSGVLEGDVIADNGVTAKKGTEICGDLVATKGSDIHLKSVDGSVYAENTIVTIDKKIEGHATADGVGSKVISKEIGGDANALEGEVIASEEIGGHATADGVGSKVISKKIVFDAKALNGGEVIASEKIGRHAIAGRKNSKVTTKEIVGDADALNGGEVIASEKIGREAIADGAGSKVTTKEIIGNANALNGGEVNASEKIGMDATVKGAGSKVISKEIAHYATAINNGIIYTNKVGYLTDIEDGGALKTYIEYENPEKKGETIYTNYLLSRNGVSLDVKINAKEYHLFGGNLSNAILSGGLIKKLTKDTILPPLCKMSDSVRKSVPLGRKWRAFRNYGDPNYQQFMPKSSNMKV